MHCACGQALVVFAAGVLGSRMPLDSLPLLNALAAQTNFLKTAAYARPAQMVQLILLWQTCKLCCCRCCCICGLAECDCLHCALAYQEYLYSHCGSLQGLSSQNGLHSHAAQRYHTKYDRVHRPSLSDRTPIQGFCFAFACCSTSVVPLKQL